MPKKTKKQKVIADYRRKFSTIREVVPARSDSINPASMTRPTWAQTQTAPRAVTAAQPMDREIRKDLIKTLILATVAIGGEVALSFLIR